MGVVVTHVGGQWLADINSRKIIERYLVYVCPELRFFSAAEIPVKHYSLNNKAVSFSIGVDSIWYFSWWLLSPFNTYFGLSVRLYDLANSYDIPTQKYIVDPRFKDTCLIRTAHYYGQFILP